MKIYKTTIADLVNNLDFIKERIPQKSDLNKEEVSNRLKDRKYKIYVAKKFSELEGITVCYEENKDLYIWLGAVRNPNNGTMSKLFNHIDKKTNYKRWYVKTKENNIGANKFLKKFGFREYYKKDDLLYLEKYL